MANSIFKLVGEIFVENDKANKNIDDTGKKAEGLGSKLAKGVGTAAKFGAGIAAGAGAAATAMFGLANSAASTGDEIQKGAQKMGLSYANYQKLSYALDRSGASIDNLSKGMKNITKDLSEITKGNDKARASYDALGVSLTDANGEMRSAEEVMNDSLLALADMTDETERNALAQEIFGNGYTELIPLLESGSEGIKALTQSAEDLGLVMSDEAVDAGASFGDALADVKDSVGAVATEFGASLMPVITDLLNWVKEHLPEIKTFINGVLETVKGFLAGVIQTVTAIWQFIEPYIPLIKDTVEGLFRGIMNFYDMHFKPFLEGLKNFVVEVLIPTVTEVIEGLSPVVDTIFGTIESLWTDTLKPVLTGIIDFLTGVFAGDWEKAWQGLKSIVSGIWDGLVTVIKLPINLLIDGLNTLIDFLKGAGDGIIHLGLILAGQSSLYEVFQRTAAQLPDSPIPKLAKGGIISASGQAIVGEDGAELINLPAGATVTPLNNNNNAFVETNKKLDQLISLFSNFSRMGVYINGDALVGEISQQMDTSLGALAFGAGRGL